MDKDLLELKHATQCSLKTIQSDEKGFFLEMYESVKNECTKKWLNNKFGSSSSTSTGDREKLQILFNEESNVSDILLGTLEHVQPVYKKKNAQISMEKRIAGEKLVALNEYDKALILFSQAILRAPPKDENVHIDGGLSLAFALWSRSKIFIILKNGENALKDLQYALANGLPSKQHGEYYGRLAKAHALIGETAKVKICINLAERFQTDQIALAQLKTDVNEIVSNPIVSDIKQVPKLTQGENSNLENASNLLTVINNENDGGNYIIARDNVSTGDILLVEKPLIACLLPKCFGTHCLHCFKRLIAPVGCPNCSGIAFCSVECMNSGCSTYHKFECNFMDLLIGSGMSILCFIALRFITQSISPAAAIANGRKLIKQFCGHSELRKVNDYLLRSVMASFLLRVLQKSNYFGHRKTESAHPDDIELDIAEILLGLLQILQFNAHEIYETQLGENHRFTGSKHIYIAVGLYKTGALFNHDCYPTVTRYFIGNTIVLRALHPVVKGDCVAENYGPIYTKRNLNERQCNLRARYWFQCNCLSCKENWQQLDKLNNKARLKCPTPMCTNLHNYPENPRKTINCKKCRKTISLLESVRVLFDCEEMYRKGAELMEKENTTDAINQFIEGINLFYTIAVPPHKDTQIAEESLRACCSNEGITYGK